MLVNGVVDVHAAEAGGLLVVDYKSDALDGREPAELTARDVLHPAARLRARGLRAGAERVEVVHCFLERPDEPAAATYAAADAERLEASCSSSPRGVVEGRFEPAAEPHLRAVRRLPRPGRAVLLGRGAHARSGSDLPFRQVPHLLCG